MTTKTHVDRLWREFRQIIDATYRDAANANDHETARAIRDYVTNMSPFDQLDRLEEEETRNERQHQSLRPASVPHAPLSNRSLARILVLKNAVDTLDSLGETMPPATNFLTMRRSAAESVLLGWLCRREIKARPTFAVDCVNLKRREE